MIILSILPTSLIHFSWKGWENVFLSLGVKELKTKEVLRMENQKTFWKNISVFPDQSLHVKKKKGILTHNILKIKWKSILDTRNSLPG